MIDVRMFGPDSTFRFKNGYPPRSKYRKCLGLLIREYSFSLFQYNRTSPVPGSDITISAAESLFFSESCFYQLARCVA